ncbi:MAG: DUF309 domain-containing protein [Candidatus Binatia bacterium]|nr:DUF309 domain-containing protein [Candidatus Binatia bacterium]
MRIETRNLLSAFLVEALDDHVAAAALRCLAAYSRAVRNTPPAMSVDRFLLPVGVTERDAVLAYLRGHPLLSWDLRGRCGRVTLAPAFAVEYAVIVPRLIRYGAVLAEWQPDATASALTTALRKGALLFNHRLFFEVHEVLEAQWVKETGDERRFLQGLIQVAVAFYHLENGNLRGARSLLQEGLAKLSLYVPAFLGVESGEFVAALEGYRSFLAGLAPEELPPLDQTQIPLLRLSETSRERIGYKPLQ